MRQIGVKNVKLSEYEMSIAAHLVDPLSMQVNFTFSQTSDRIRDHSQHGALTMTVSPITVPLITPPHCPHYVQFSYGFASF